MAGTVGYPALWSMRRIRSTGDRRDRDSLALNFSTDIHMIVPEEIRMAKVSQWPGRNRSGTSYNWKWFTSCTSMGLSLIRLDETEPLWLSTALGAASMISWTWNRDS